MRTPVPGVVGRKPVHLLTDEERRNALPRRPCQEVLEPGVAEVGYHRDDALVAVGAGEPVGLEEGLARMAAWARSAAPRDVQAFEAIEVGRNMPSAWRSRFHRAGDPAR